MIDIIFSFFPQYCFARIIFAIFFNGNIKKSCDQNEFTKTACEEAGIIYCEDVLTYDAGGIGDHLFRSGLLILLYFAILGLIEWNEGTMLIKRIAGNVFGGTSTRKTVQDSEAEIQFEDDSDVINIAKKINANANELTKQHSLVVNNLEKSYSGFQAVKGVSFMVKPNSCFGLLGPNGAGKTSTFKMLTGEESVSKGEAFINGLEIQKDRFGSLREFGYCPQFDALLQQLTGRETLYLYGRLRGVPENILPKVKMF